MDRSRLRVLIEKSTLLSHAERGYWLEHLPTMSDAQCTRLAQILAVPSELPVASQLDQYFSALDQAAKAALKHGNRPMAA
jgi:hypothetical protein